MSQELPEPEFLTVPMAARLCGVSRNTLFGWVKGGKLKAYQTPGKTNLIRPSDLVAFMEASGMFVPDGLLQKDPAAEAGAEEDPSLPRVLVVDDEDKARELVARALKGRAVVQGAENGFEGLHQLVKNTEFSIVLLDLNMPGFNGKETLREIERIRPDLRVFLYSGSVDQEAENLLKEGKIEGILRKPVTISDLRGLVEG